MSNMVQSTKNFFWRQFLATTPSLLIAINTGMIFGFTATLLPELQRISSDIQISSDDATWIASSPPLFMVMGCLIGGPLMEQYGRKAAFFIQCVPNLMGWITIYFAPDLLILLIGRSLDGFSAGIFASIFTAYIAETTDPKYRGVFLSAPSAAMTFGILVVHVCGTFITWRHTALLATIFPVTAFISNCFMPETPSWYISKNRFDDALNSFVWLRGEAARAEFDDSWEEHKKTDEVSVGFLDAFRRPEFMKPFSITLICFITMQFSGVHVVAFYSINILEKALGCDVNEYLMMLVIDGLRLAVSLAAAYLLRVCKRRFILITSGVGSAISAFMLAALLHFTHVESWILVLAIVGYIIFCGIGIAVIPWCIAGELIPMECRSLGSSLNTSFNFVLLFVVVKVSPEIFDRFGIDGTFLFYGLVCVIGTFVLSMVLPETKDRTLVEIERFFTKERREPDKSGKLSERP